MKFALKYWWYAYREMIKGSWKMIIFMAVSVLLITLFAILVSVGFEFTLPLFVKTFIEFLLFVCIIFYVGLAIIVSIGVKKDYCFYKIIDKKGYCMEALNHYKEKYIQGKPVNEGKYLGLAELYRRLGDYDSAIKTLNYIHVPESNIYLRTEYVYVFIKIAVNNNDTILADNIWKSNQNFINYVISENKFGENINVLYLAMIYADCIAGRDERAFKICDSFLKSEHMRKFKGFKENFLVLKIYLLKKLGRDSEINNAVIEFNNYVANGWKPLLEVTRTELRNDVEKAIRGELPV